MREWSWLLASDSNQVPSTSTPTLPFASSCQRLRHLCHFLAHKALQLKFRRLVSECLGVDTERFIDVTVLLELQETLLVFDKAKKAILDGERPILVLVLRDVEFLSKGVKFLQPFRVVVNFVLGLEVSKLFTFFKQDLLANLSISYDA